MVDVDGDRRVHLVGTIPAESASAALELVAETVGDATTEWLPDGETGDRQNWIGRLVESLRHHPDLTLTKDGDWSDYESTPGFRVRRGHRFDYVELDYFEHFEDSWPTFEKARSELGRSDLALQVGIPGPIDLAFAAFGFNPLLGLMNSGPFEDAAMVEISKIHDIAGQEIVYQLEIPIEVEVVNRVPKPARGLVARWLAGRILRLVRRSPHGTRWGFHLCVGDMNNKAFSRLEDTTSLVLLANALVRQFPSHRTLEFVHLPLAHGAEPPSRNREFYEPLAGLALPSNVRLIAGYAHEEQALSEQLEVRSIIEELARRPADVAASCGLGRRDLNAAEANLRQSRALLV